MVKDATQVLVASMCKHVMRFRPATTLPGILAHALGRIPLEYSTLQHVIIGGPSHDICYAMLCYAMLCYAMLCYAMLCYAMPCYTSSCYGVPCSFCPMPADKNH